MTRRACRIFALFLALAVPLPLNAAEPVPQQTEAAKALVEDFHATLIRAMKDGASLSFAGRAATLAPAVQRTFSLGFMCQLIVGPEWRRLDPPRQQMVLAAFADWVVAQYASQFTAWDGERFTTQGVSGGGKGTLIVETAIVPAGSAPVELGYRLMDGRVIDIYLEGSVSQLALWRSQFASVIKREGIDGLIGRLQAQARQLASP